MSDEETTSADHVGILKGCTFVVMMIVAGAFVNDARFRTSGDYENRLNPAQRIVFTSGSYSSGTARVICYQTTRLNWISQDDETVQFSRTDDKVTLSGTKGIAVFTISNRGLTDSEGGVWDRKFRGD